MNYISLGYGCDDSMLKELGRLCRCLKSLTIGGRHVTDEGIRHLCGFLDNLPITVMHSDDIENEQLREELFMDHIPADVCFTLQHLDINRAINITEAGIKMALLNLKSLRKLECTDNRFVSVCLNMDTCPEFEDYKSALAFLDLNNHNRTGEISFTSLADHFPHLESLHFSNNDYRSKPFKCVEEWKRFGNLRALNLKTFQAKHVIEIADKIGSQITTLEWKNMK